MWNNKMDVIGALHRTNYHTDKTDPFAVFATHKVKKQNLVGLPGEVDIKFERRENRYYINGKCPLIEPGLQPEYQSQQLPISNFENETAPF
jgi:twinkle protein